ncbi:S9 family peptidase [Variovorax sp. WS11]|uniref:alpha/beta hydrolase family protein n=1 Tax=Variovorax sp. WS11 TaxID=1105204 RepID=UPI0019521AF1|nr:alpha/beta fold hydrolase [Variovorax sp. WS11]
MRAAIWRVLVAGGWMLCASATAAAQTAWPPSIAVFEPALSESPVPAVLPADVAVRSPDPALAPDKARFSGLWQGWACPRAQCDVRIAVEQVGEREATVVYAGANAWQGLITDRAVGEFEGGELRLRLRTGAKLLLRLREGSGDMEISLWRPDTQLLSFGVLTQKPLNPTYTRRVERVPTPWTEDGRPQTLEMVVYQPLGPGPYPTLVFNHGSTGTGDKPEWFLLTWTAPEVARYFVDKGWQVLFPQRRGRGQSDGLYDEGFERDRSRYACRPELAIPGLDRAVADLDVVMAHVRSRADVNPQRLLIGGVSRGGILSVAYAGAHPDWFRGVVNFVGGWVGDRCSQADAVNPVIFRRGAAFAQPTLWLYGDKDPFYALRHSRRNFDAFIEAGGRGAFESYAPPPGLDGHSIYLDRSLWAPAMERYLAQIAAP